MSDSLFRRTPVLVRLGAAVGVALLAAACSSGSGSSSSATSAATGTAAAASSAAGSGSAMVITTKSSSGGTFLTNASGRAVYMFVKDGHDQSSCTGSCASTWPPVTTTGAVTGSGSVVSADLGTITRSDGTKQVTYDGHPLYYYAGDTGAGMVNGQGSKQFGASWWILAPSGSAITSAVTVGAPASTGSGGGGSGGGTSGGGGGGSSWG